MRPYFELLAHEFVAGSALPRLRIEYDLHCSGVPNACTFEFMWNTSFACPEKVYVDIFFFSLQVFAKIQNL